MGKTTDQWLRIIEAGANIEVDADGKVTENLVTIASAAATRGVQMKLLNADAIVTDNLVKIVQAGRGCVTVSDAFASAKRK